MAAPTVAARPTSPGEAPRGHVPPRRYRRWPRRVLIGLNVFVAICLMAAASLYGYVSYRFGQIKHVSLSTLIHGPAPDGNGAAGSSSPAGPPMNILVIGSDTRNLSATDKGQFGVGSPLVGGQRSDTIMLVHLNPAAGTAALLSIPRDLWVPIPGHGNNRINSAFDTSADLLVRTIQDNLGIPINHFVEVDFDSFRQVVNALGGVKFWYPEPVKDSDNGVNDSGLNITGAGCYTLSGDMALSLVRTRHLVYYSNGSWHAEAESDLARIRRQQMFVKKVIAKAEATGIVNFTRLNGVVGGVVSNLTVDSGFGTTQMLSLARRYKSFNPANLWTSTLPTYGANIGGAAVLLLQKDQSQQVISAWEGYQPGAAPASSATTAPVAAVDPSTVSVQVLNGSGISHQAADASQQLRTAGFSIDGTGEAAHFGYATSVVEYAPGDEAKAQFLQSKLIGGASLQPDSSLTSGRLVLVTGSSFGGVSGSPSSSASSTASTAPAAAVVPAATTPTTKPAFPGPQGADPPPPGSGC